MARIQATVTSKRSFDNEWIKIQLCEFGYCSKSMYKNGQLSSTYKNGGQICDWLTVTEDEEEKKREEEEQEAQQREKEKAERAANENNNNNNEMEYFYRRDSSTGRWYRVYRYGEGGGRTLYYRYTNNNNKNGNNYRAQKNNSNKHGNYYRAAEPSQDGDKGYYKRDQYGNYYRVNKDGEPEDEPEEEREFQCGDPGTYILDHTFEIPTKDDLPTGWSWFFKSTGSINITVGLEKKCETFEFTFSSVGIASFVLIGAGAYAEKKRRSKKRSNGNDDHADDKSTQYLEMGGMAVV